jgi:NitT/TauT family transport system substrate-binding protein
MGGVRRYLALFATATFLLAACSGSSASTGPTTRSGAPATTRATARGTTAPSSAATGKASSGGTTGTSEAGSPAASSSDSASAASLGSASPGSRAAGSPAKVSLQLQWYPQAQFAGYFAAKEQGYYQAENIDVNIIGGSGTIAPQIVGSVATGPEFVVAWVPKVLQAREVPGAEQLVDIAQIFQRSGTLSVSWKSSNITKPADFKGKKVGVWDFGNEFEVTAGAKKAGLEQGTDYTKYIQDFDMTMLLSKQIDVAEAMIYNEYAQLLESLNPDTGELVKPTNLNVINWNDVGTAMLQDAVFARESWLKQPGHEDVAIRFLRASFKGWIYCRSNPEDCVQYTINAGAKLGAGHQRWMMNEVNPLVWPSPNGIGAVDPVLWKQTVDTSVAAGIIKAAPSPGAYRTDLAAKALEGVTDDTKGTDFKKGSVEVTPGGF